VEGSSPAREVRSGVVFLIVGGVVMAAIPIPYRDRVKQFSLPLSLDHKKILDRLHQKSGLSRADIFRQLLLHEDQAPPEAKSLATREARRGR
jgi:hypothetical protein